MKESNQIQKPPLSYDDADECFRSALRRIAICLNSANDQLCRHSWLSLTDEQLSKKFLKKDLDGSLISFLLSSPMAGNSKAIRASDADRAEHEFYGRFQLQERSTPPRLHVTFNSTEVFRKWSLESLHVPASNDSSILSMFEENEKQAFSKAFTNYLVKNFWHNIVHLKLQNINDLNFHEFGGDARYESDFVADNMANILLAISYGHKINTRGRQAHDTQDKCKRLFELNRCNRVFAERALQRNEGNSELEKFLERAWRFKRQVANTLSIKLICLGAAVSDIAIYFNGKLKKQDGNRDSYYYSGDVVVRLNSSYYNTGCPPYLVDSNAVDLTEVRISDIRRFHAKRVMEIVNLSATSYLAKLKKDKGLRDFSSASLLAQQEKLLRS